MLTSSTSPTCFSRIQATLSKLKEPFSPIVPLIRAQEALAAWSAGGYAALSSTCAIAASVFGWKPSQI